MVAIRVSDFGGPEVLRVASVELPEPGQGQVAVRMEAVGINPVETYIRSGSNPHLPRPYTPGSDGAGVVSAIGAGVMRVAVGDRVYLSGSLTGTYAEACLCEERTVHLLPAHLTSAQGAAINIPYATALRALRDRAQAKTGETVLIHGASGGVGLAAIQIARRMGLRIIGTAGSPEGLALLLKMGAAVALDHTQPDYWFQIPEITGGNGPDIILEMLSNVNLAIDCQLIAKRGRIVVIGCRGKIEINPRDLMIKEADVRGLLLFNCLSEELASLHHELGDGLADGSLQPIIGQAFPLAEAAKAHQAVLASGARGKIILTV